MKPEELEIGSEIGGFKLEEILGRGGMGVVYRAHELSLNRKVALKILSQKLSSDPEFIQRFKREAQIIASLDHPNIVRILAYGEEKGLYYFAMEYIRGKDLGQILKEKSKIPLDEALDITAKIASALIEADSKRVVHRDLKPTNIMIDEKGRVKITDFGVAHLQETDIKLTRTGWFLGTPEFASPEQARGDPIDIRSDIYSLGVILYMMLSGKPPLTGDSPQAVLIKIATEPLPPIKKVNPHVPEPVCKLIEKMTAKDLNSRFQKPDELLSAIEDCMDKLKKESIITRTPTKEENLVGKRRFVRVLGTTLGIALAVFLIVWLGEAMFIKKRVPREERNISEISKVEESQPSAPETKPSPSISPSDKPANMAEEKPSQPVPPFERSKQTEMKSPLSTGSEKIAAIPKSQTIRDIPNVLIVVSGNGGMIHFLQSNLASIVIQGGLRVMMVNEIPKLREKIQVGDIPITFHSIKEDIPRDRADILLLAQIQKTGSMTLRYYGQTQELITASFNVQVVDATSGMSIIPPSTGSAKFTALNMEENLKEAINSAVGDLDEKIKRYWAAKKASSR